MSRKSVLLAVVILLLLAGGAGTGLVLLVRHVPEFYSRAGVPEGAHRQDLSKAFIGEFTNRVVDGILNKNEWDAQFTDEQINSYFAEDFLTKHSAENPLPEGISDPRVALEPDRIRLGFRYGTEPWSTIVSVDMKVWLVHKEPNVVALEVQALHAGALPVSPQSFLDRLAEAADKQHISVSYYRHNTHPVVLLQFQSNRSQPTFLLRNLELRTGMLHIAGRSLDGAGAVSASTGSASGAE